MALDQMSLVTSVTDIRTVKKGSVEVVTEAVVAAMDQEEAVELSEEFVKLVKLRLNLVRPSKRLTIITLIRFRGKMTSKLRTLITFTPRLLVATEATEKDEVEVSEVREVSVDHVASDVEMVSSEVAEEDITLVGRRPGLMTTRTMITRMSFTLSLTTSSERSTNVSLPMRESTSETNWTRMTSLASAMSSISMKKRSMRSLLPMPLTKNMKDSSSSNGKLLKPELRRKPLRDVGKQMQKLGGSRELVSNRCRSASANAWRNRKLVARQKRKNQQEDSKNLKRSALLKKLRPPSKKKRRKLKSKLHKRRKRKSLRMKRQRLSRLLRMANHHRPLLDRLTRLMSKKSLRLLKHRLKALLTQMK